MKLSALKNILSAKLIGDDKEFNSVSIDTRTLQDGDLFFAITGQQFDGHQFLAEATKRGAIAAVVEREIPANIPLLVVEKVTQALMQLAHYHREQLNPTVIAVTGSCGKTTVRSLLANIFGLYAPTLASEKSYNNEIGVPLTLMRLKPEHKFAVCELGANHKGEIAVLTQLVKPDIAIITNAATAHLAGFGSLEGVAQAKGEIYQGLTANGVAIINADDQYADYWKTIIGAHKIFTFAVNTEADITAKNISFNEKAQPQFTIVFPEKTIRPLSKHAPVRKVEGGSERRTGVYTSVHEDSSTEPTNKFPTGVEFGKRSIEIKMQLMGAHNVKNALAAAAAAYLADIPLETIKQGIETCEAVNERLVEKKGYAGAVIIDDSYNANPLSVAAAIDVLAHRTGDKILVLGDMLELGESSAQMHASIGQEALRRGVNKLYCYGTHTQNTVKKFGDNAYHFQDRNLLISTLKKELTQNTTVLIKGSRSMQMDLVAAALLER